MPDDAIFVITSVPAEAQSRLKVEICEHKGIGHPDSICDGAAEAVSRALCLEYLRAYGQVQHHNVDKALLVGGESAPRFGGGKIVVPPRLIVCGRATPLLNTDLGEFVRDAAREYLGKALRCDPGIFSIESAVHNGSDSLRQAFSRGRAKALANDTSFGCGHAPYSELERAVLRLSTILRSSDFRTTFRAAGDDYKIMGARIEQKMTFTIALAFIDREIGDVSGYFRIKHEIVCHLQPAIGESCEIHINMLDDPKATDESGIYLTVTGLSGEHGDDGQVGRGNRVNGLITPCRTMSLEAAAGKNPVAHVGKIYNVLALEMARAISAEVDGITEASVQILSTIGKPVAEPQLVAIEVVAKQKIDGQTEAEIKEAARSCLERVDQISDRLIRGEIPVF
jgi:S-adenosylmethionine synthetase